METIAPTKTICPYCREEIKEGAIICPHCRTHLTPGVYKSEQTSKAMTHLFLAILAFVVLFLFLSFICRGGTFFAQ
jgi:hypothetical protein